MHLCLYRHTTVLIHKILRSINSSVLTSLLPSQISSSLTDFLPSLNLLYFSETDAIFMQDGQSKCSLKHFIRFCGIFPSLNLNYIAYHSSKVSSRPDCIFEIHQLWQSGFSGVYSNSCYSCSSELDIINISQSSHEMDSKKILNFQESKTILNACTKSMESYWRHILAPLWLWQFLWGGHRREVFAPSSFCIWIKWFGDVDE